MSPAETIRTLSSDLWRLKDGKAEPLTSDDFTEFDVTASPDGAFVVFASNRAGNQHLFRIELVDRSIRQLTSGESFDDSPDISPDGNWMVYNAVRLSGRRHAGGESVQITDYNAIAPVFSPDGTQISAVLPAGKVTENATLAIISASGGTPVQTFRVIPFGWDYRPSVWTPDGMALTFRKTEKAVTNIWKQPIDGRAPAPLTNFKAEHLSNYVFTRDGRHLITARGHHGGGVTLIRNF